MYFAVPTGSFRLNLFFCFFPVLVNFQVIANMTLTAPKDEILTPDDIQTQVKSAAYLSATTQNYVVESSEIQSFEEVTDPSSASLLVWNMLLGLVWSVTMLFVYL